MEVEEESGTESSPRAPKRGLGRLCEQLPAGEAAQMLSLARFVVSSNADTIRKDGRVPLTVLLCRMCRGRLAF